MTRALLAALVAVALLAPAAAAAPPRASLPDVEDEVMCLECGTALNVSNSPVADEERAFIRQLIARGLTKDQVKAALVREYGPRILAEPQGSGFSLTAWLVPIAAGGVDTTVVAAFSVGFVSFISPCVLPLVPGYLSAVSGVSVGELQKGERSPLKVLLPAIVFCLSFTVVFVALGMTATGLGSTLQDSRGTLDKVAGAVIIALGVLFIVTPFVPKLNREWRPEMLMSRAGSGGPLVAGAAFAVAWTPCVGPTLGSILTAASVQDTVAQGAVLLLFYSAGLAVPFLLTAVAFTRAWGAFRWLRDRYLIVTAVSGLVLVAMGVLLLTGELTRLNTEAQQALDSLGLNVFGDL